MSHASYDDTLALIAILQNCTKRLLSPTIIEPEINDIEENVSDDDYLAILAIEQTFKMNDLKKEVKKNLLLNEHVIGNKTFKRTWSTALHQSTKWGFNAFIVGVKKNKNSELCGQIDVLLHIQKFM